jgi:RNA polymerase sigma factor (sigma-70 family)
MGLAKYEMIELAEMVATTVVEILEKKGLIGAPEPASKTEKTAYQKTEQLLYNYNGFKRVVQERLEEIEDLKKYGIPRSSAVTEYVQKGGLPKGIVLEEESVEGAIANVQRSVQDTVQAITLIDKCMEALKTDPYYCILEMRYFEGRTQEDIADHLGCSQVTVSKNKNRLVRELSMRLFPNQTIGEMMK